MWMIGMNLNDYLTSNFKSNSLFIQEVNQMATCQCPNCRNRFQVLEDEYGDHPCPNCGYHPDQEEEED
jgi:Zn finger protein HypA/HybF involved in hydrogenase expression